MASSSAHLEAGIRWLALGLVPLVWFVSAGELRAQDRKPAEVTEAARVSDETLMHTHLGRGPLSAVLAPYDDLLDRLREEHAFGLALTYSPIYQVAGRGGSDNMTLNHDLSLYADWTVIDHPIFGRGRVDLYVNHQADQLIGTDTVAFADHVGSNWLLSNTGNWTSLASLWWDQLMFDGHLDVTFGQLDPTLIFDVNTYASWDRVSFLATPVSGNPVRLLETPGLGIYVELLEPGVGYICGTVMDADADGRYPDFKSLGNGRLAYFIEAGLSPTIPSLGLLEVALTLTASDRTKDGPAARALLFNLSQNVGEHYSLFFRYGHNDGKRGGVDQMVSGGIIAKGLFGFTSDWIGASFMWTHPAEPGLRDQYGIETYWRLQLTNRIQFTPDLQLIIHPSYRPTRDVEVVASLRLFIQI